MSYDKSKIEYSCIHCNKLPCECKREHKSLTYQLFKCDPCGDVFFTINKLQEHNSYKHGVPVPITEGEQAVLTITHVKAELNGHVVYEKDLP